MLILRLNSYEHVSLGVSTSRGAWGVGYLW